jgi:hypothetical protein
VPPGFDVSKLPPLPEPIDDEEDAAKAAPPPPPQVAAACTGPDCPPADVTFVEAPGAHTPTQAQAKPVKSLTLMR